MTQDFHRIKRLPPYVFAEVNALKSKARAAGKDIIDFGMGNPDMDTPAHIVEKLVETFAQVRKMEGPRLVHVEMSRGVVHRVAVRLGGSGGLKEAKILLAAIAGGVLATPLAAQEIDYTAYRDDSRRDLLLEAFAGMFARPGRLMLTVLGPVLPTSSRYGVGRWDAYVGWSELLVLSYAVTGIVREASLNRLIDSDIEPVPLPPDGLVLSTKMAEILGMQDVRTFGVPAESHFAQVLVEADYLMKRIAVGLSTGRVRVIGNAGMHLGAEMTQPSEAGGDVERDVIVRRTAGEPGPGAIGILHVSQLAEQAGDDAWEAAWSAGRAGAT